MNSSKTEREQTTVRLLADGQTDGVDFRDVKNSLIFPHIKEAITVSDINEVIDLMSTGRWIVIECWNGNDSIHYHLVRVVQV